MSLVLEIEFLTGVYRGTRSSASKAPDWPPQPDRVFSALVSAWANRGERKDERQALEWLENQPPPAVHASSGYARTAPDVFVPPNDPKYSRTAKRYLEVMPEGRRRQPRHFPAMRPEDPMMALIWLDEPGSDLFGFLDDVAREVGYLGHSASLVRCRFLRTDSETFPHPRVPARRVVYPGRLAELKAAHNANPIRPVIAPGASVPMDSSTPRIDLPTENASRQLENARDKWLVLEAIAGETPDIRASALVCRMLRRALMSGYRRTASGEAIPEIVSGHTLDRRPTRCPHLAIVPLAFVGHSHADGRVFGFALVPPTGVDFQDVHGFLQAFAAIAPYDHGRGRRVLRLECPPLKSQLELATVEDQAPRSLSPYPYLKPARVWASVTPIVLDRHLKGKGDDEVHEIIADACENVGLPRPEPDRIQIGKHSAVNGAPPAWPPGGAPTWNRWKVPEAFITRSLVHASIDFGHEMCGPVLLGAGRFTGLGLCRGIGN